MAPVLQQSEFFPCVVTKRIFITLDCLLASIFSGTCIDLLTPGITLTT